MKNMLGIARITGMPDLKITRPIVFGKPILRAKILGACKIRSISAGETLNGSHVYRKMNQHLTVVSSSQSSVVGLAEGGKSPTGKAPVPSYSDFGFVDVTISEDRWTPQLRNLCPHFLWSVFHFRV